MPGQAPRFTINLEDVKDPGRLHGILERLSKQDYDLLDRLSRIASAPAAIPLSPAPAPSSDDLSNRIVSLEQAVQSLLTGGSDSALPSQRAAVPSAAALPPVATASEGDLVWFGSTLYRFNSLTSAWELDSLAGQFTAYAYAGAVQTLTTAVEANIAMNSELFDRGNCHDLVTNNTRITVPPGGGGTWLFIGHIAFAASGVGERQAALYGNGAANIARQRHPAAAAGLTIVEVVAITQPAAGDYVELAGLQTSGGNLNTDVTNASYTNLIGFQLSR